MEQSASMQLDLITNHIENSIWFYNSASQLAFRFNLLYLNESLCLNSISLALCLAYKPIYRDASCCHIYLNAWHQIGYSINGY